MKLMHDRVFRAEFICMILLLKLSKFIKFNIAFLLIGILSFQGRMNTINKSKKQDSEELKESNKTESTVLNENMNGSDSNIILNTMKSISH